MHTDLTDLLSDPGWQVLVLRHLGISALKEAFSLADSAAITDDIRGDLAAIADAISESAHVVAGGRAEGSIGPAAELLPGQLAGRLRGLKGPLLNRFQKDLNQWHRRDGAAAVSGDLLTPVTACLPAISQRLQRSIAGHQRPVLAVVLSPDGRTGISCDDWCILIWDASTGVGANRGYHATRPRRTSSSPSQYAPDRGTMGPIAKLIAGVLLVSISHVATRLQQLWQPQSADTDSRQAIAEPRSGCWHCPRSDRTGAESRVER